MAVKNFRGKFMNELIIRKTGTPSDVRCDNCSISAGQIYQGRNNIIFDCFHDHLNSLQYLAASKVSPLSQPNGPPPPPPPPQLTQESSLNLPEDIFKSLQKNSKLTPDHSLTANDISKLDATAPIEVVSLGKSGGINLNPEEFTKAAEVEEEDKESHNDMSNASAVSAKYKTVVCMFWIDGKCKKGENCTFKHILDQEKLPLC